MGTAAWGQSYFELRRDRVVNEGICFRFDFWASQLINRELAVLIRGIAAKGNIFSAIGSVTEAITGKLTQPSDVAVEEMHEACEHSGSGRKKVEIEVDVEETQPRYLAAKLKEADQISGQTFNDVGRINDEGTIRLECREKR